MLNDIRYAFRVLRQNPGVTVLAILALALGIGANAAIFTVVNGVMLRPLPYKDPERLVFVRADVDGEIGHAGLADSEISDLREQSKLIESIGWLVTPTASLTGGSDMEHVTAATASDQILPVLGVQPVLGRGLSAKEDLGTVRVRNLLISYDLWERRYQRDPNIIGKPIEVNNFTATIVGVLPQGFRVYLGSGINVPPRIDIWFPAESYPSRRYHHYSTIARLRPSVTLNQVQAEFDAIAARMVQLFPKDYPDGSFRFRLVPLHEDLVKPVRTAVFLLMGAVGFVLLIACANIANLMLARAAGRRKEIAVRSALGATRLRVIRQLLTESVLLSFAGGAAGLLLARWGVLILLELRPQNLPRLDDIVLNGTVTAFACALSLLCGILFGLAPALHAAKVDFSTALKESGRALSAGIAGSRLRLGIVAGQVALSLVLLIGAGLMIRTFANLRGVDLGFDPANVLTFRLEVSPVVYGDFDQRWRFYKGAMEAVNAQPGVESASGVMNVPLDPFEETDYYSTEDDPGQRRIARLNAILPDYFRTMKIPLVAGRDFTNADNDDAAVVAIVDETFAARNWPGQNAVGKRITLPAQTTIRSKLAEIVGVARHVQYDKFREEARPVIYLPYRNLPYTMTMTVRTRVDPMSLAQPLRKLVEGLGGMRPAYDVRLMGDYVADGMAEARFALVLLGVMSVVAFALSVIGIYGVVSYSVAERMQEFAIRMALGAQARDIFRLALGWGVAPTLGGIAAGLGFSLLLTRFLSSLLFGVSATDLVTYLTVSTALLTAALLACYIPVRFKALRADPKSFLN